MKERERLTLLLILRLGLLLYFSQDFYDHKKYLFDTNTKSTLIERQKGIFYHILMQELDYMIFVFFQVETGNTAK